MRRAAALPVIVSLLAAACAGTAPSLGHRPEQGLSSVLIGGRIILPTGETRSGRIWINFEGEGDKGNGETYRLAVKPGESLLYQVEPDSYHLAPTRSVFGAQQEKIKARIEGRTYYADFPRSILRKAAIVVKPTKIVPLGVLEVRLQRALPGRQPAVSVFLDDSITARRKLTEDTIHEMMDPDAPRAYRENAIQWTQALDTSLTELSTEPTPVPLYKRGAP